MEGQDKRLRLSCVVVLVSMVKWLEGGLRSRGVKGETGESCLWFPETIEGITPPGRGRDL